MRVTADDVRHVADLARLGLEPDRVAQLAQELTAILDHMDVLGRAVPPGTEPMEGVPITPAALREDAPGADPTASSLADLAPVMRDGLFLVPRLAAHDGAAG